MRILTLLVVAVSALAVAGCETTIDDEKAEKSIRDSISAEGGAEIESVECPADQVAKKGGTFTCKITGADGSTGEADVLMADDEGHIRVRAPFVPTDELAASVTETATRELSVAADGVTCPDLVPLEKGTTIQCTGSNDGEPVTFDVTLTDAKGRFRVKVADQ